MQGLTPGGLSAISMGTTLSVILQFATCQGDVPEWSKTPGGSFKSALVIESAHVPLVCLLAIVSQPILAPAALIKDQIIPPLLMGPK